MRIALVRYLLIVHIGEGRLYDFRGVCVWIHPRSHILFPQNHRHAVMDKRNLFTWLPCENGEDRILQPFLFFDSVKPGEIPMTAFATSEVVSRINSLQTLVMGIITAAGAIVLAWGVFDFAAGYQAHDTSQQTQSLKKVVAGILMLLAQSVVNMLS